jgi:hypothetical protein
MLGKVGILCEVCKEDKLTRLCDYATGTGIVTSENFQEVTQTCDKKMCNKCAVILWANCEVCPEHADEIKRKLLKVAYL